MLENKFHTQNFEIYSQPRKQYYQKIMSIQASNYKYAIYELDKNLESLDQKLEFFSKHKLSLANFPKN